MTSSTKFRYSTGVLSPNEAPKFDWEYPVPVSDFWNSFKYPSARSFLICFSQAEIDDMHLEKHKDLDDKQKVTFLLTIVKDKIAALENSDHSPWETEFPIWQKFMSANIAMYGELGLLNEEIEAEERVLEKRGDSAIPAHAHGLAYLLANRGLPGDFEKSEELERKAIPWFDENLGENSPQALSVRRVLATAVWGQERYPEAEELIAEIFNLIDDSKTGEYGIYQDEERQLVNELVVELKGLKAKKSGTTQMSQRI